MNQIRWNGYDTGTLKQHYADFTGFNPDYIQVILYDTKELMFTYPLDKLENFHQTFGLVTIQANHLSEVVSLITLTERVATSKPVIAVRASIMERERLKNLAL
ncbi:hypothetical protein CLV58_109173 [Spirosoma oryzae]|uniref:Uncharacterized protein n=1 Tax=Spirosoma oryzae TaxID=1469603 RepID=A0A2T0SYF8_9BACT|nr:hypothetical protein CLV58_109173 [Spirosoma oryzae]